jgi:hypothetical protein
LCKHHHWLVHEHCYTIATGPGAAFLFFRRDGQPIPASPALPEPDGDITTCHDAAITPVPGTPGLDQHNPAADPQPAPTADQARNSTSF